MIMSSFLMNSGSYAEPKFPPNEEYSQNSYIPNHGPDYYGHQPHQNYGYINSQHAGMSYGRENSAYASHHVPNSYFQQTCNLNSQPNLAVHHSLVSSGAPPPPPGLGRTDHLGLDAGTGLSSQPSSITNPLHRSNHQHQNHHHQQRSPESSPTPPGATTHSQNHLLSASGIINKQESNVQQECNNSQNNVHPIIYPWMKKVHVNNTTGGKCPFSLPFPLIRNW